MDAEAACIVCNWVNDIPWWYFGLGAFAAGLPVVWDTLTLGAANNWGGYDYRDFPTPGMPATSNPPEQYGPPANPPPANPPVVPYRYKDSAGDPYWPGVSAVPGDGVVYSTRLNPIPGGPPGSDIPTVWVESTTPLPVNPETGIPVHPQTGIEGVEAASAQTAGSRG